jgi:hypothetical protein
MELTLKPILPTIAKLMQDQLRRQAPDGPESGDPLRKSVVVRAKESKDGVQMVTGYLTYGIFTDSGTGRYKKPNPNATFNPKPGKGKGGIKPRYWTNLDKALKMRIARIIEKELAKQIQQSFRKR